MPRPLPLLLSLAACINTDNPPTEGERGELRFTDETEHVDGGFGASGLGWAVAVGAEIDVGVYGWSEEDGEIAAALTAGEAFELVRDIGVTIRLRAVSAGESTLHVIADDAREDEVVIAAAELDAVELVRAGDAELLGLITPDGLADVEEAFLPGARMGLAAKLFGSGERLTGDISLPWSVDPNVQVTPFEYIANGAWFSSQVPGDYLVDAGSGSTWPMSVLPPDAPLTLKLYEPTYDPLVELSRIEGPAGLILIGAGLFDAGGRFVRTHDEVDLSIEILDGPANLLGSATWSAELLGFSALACPGTGTARVTLAGASVELPVTIRGEAVDGCSDT